MYFVDAEIISLDDIVLSHKVDSASQTSTEYTNTEDFNSFFEKSPATELSITVNDMTKFYQEDSVVSWYTFKMEWTMFITHLFTKSHNNIGSFFVAYRYHNSREMTIYRENGQVKVRILTFVSKLRTPYLSVFSPNAEKY